MSEAQAAFDEVVTLRQAKKLIQCMAHEQSFLLLSAPGMGKSEMVYEAAREVGLPCRSLLGTQIAPEDVSGIPRIVGERSVFCPPRILLPEKPEPFCLFLDELPACAPDVQKAFYSLLLERRLGEISGIDQMTSNSSLGSTNISLQFSLGRDIDRAARDDAEEPVVDDLAPQAHAPPDAAARLGPDDELGIDHHFLRRESYGGRSM